MTKHVTVQSNQTNRAPSGSPVAKSGYGNPVIPIPVPARNPELNHRPTEGGAGNLGPAGSPAPGNAPTS